MADEEFPEDLTGHFWTKLEFQAERKRWAFEIIDYQGNVMLSGLASSKRQAAAMVRAWDRVIVDAEESEDPSMDWIEESE